MPVPSLITDLSPTAASNSPSGSEAPVEGDNHLRTAYAFIRQLYDGATGVAYPTLAALADTSSASNGAGLVGWRPSLNYAAGTLGKAMSDRVWSITDYPFLAVGDDATDNYAAILAAQTALASAGGGTLLIPEGTFRIATAIPRVTNVDYAGLGWASILKPVSCSAFTYAVVTGFGRSKTCDMWIQGSSGTAQIGIYQAGTLDDADELYGLMIDGCAITGFNTAIQFRTLRNFTITNNWIQDVNSGIKFIGKCLRGNLANNDIVKAAGSGSGTQYGILLQDFNYTSGAGTISPEGIRIDNPYVQGFEYCIYMQAGIEIRINNVDLSASKIPILWSSVTSLSVEGGYVQCTGSSTQFGIHAPAQAAVNNSKYTLRGLNVNAVSAPAGASGIMLGTTNVDGNVDGVTVEDCEFTGWTAYDINSYACGNNVIRKNRCLSSTTAQSMNFTTCPAGRQVFIDTNQCAKLISFDQADFDSGTLQLGTNVISGTTVNYGRGAPTTPTFAAGDFTGGGSQTWTVAAGDVETYAYSFSGKMMTVFFGILTSTVGGTPHPDLRIAIPASRIATKVVKNASAYILDNLTRSVGTVQVNAGGTFIVIQKADVANWAASTNQTYVQGQITFEVT